MAAMVTQSLFIMTNNYNNYNNSRNSSNTVNHNNANGNYNRNNSSGRPSGGSSASASPQQGHQQASQRDLLHQHLHVHPLLSHPMPPGVLLHRLNPQHQRNLLQLHPDQVQVQVPEVHPVPGVEEAEDDNNPT